MNESEVLLLFMDDTDAGPQAEESDEASLLESSVSSRVGRGCACGG